MSKIPKPRLIPRQQDALHFEQLCAEGYDPVIAGVIAGRPVSPQPTFEKVLSPDLTQLDSPEQLADIDVAVQRIIEAIENQEVIALETDHDCDGQTSHAVLYTALKDFFGHPEDCLQSYIGHRLQEGYGLSDKLADRILSASPRPTLVITADNGSGDEARIARLKAEGIDTIVTDHHEIPLSGIPASAFAVINPTRSDCRYPDPYIAGCMVAWLLMAGLRKKLLEKGTLKDKTQAPLAQLLDFVAVGTVADCVSMARSVNNRAVVRFGLKQIQRFERPCWKALAPFLSAPVNAEDLGFKVGPLLNSDGRLDAAMGSVSFLLADNLPCAQAWAEQLQTQNQQRKKIQKAITHHAIDAAVKQVALDKKSICVFLEEGHAGVHGISASRIKDLFGRPVIIFSPKLGEDDQLTGSGRSIDGIHLKDALEQIHQENPSLLQAFGGHRGAAGMRILRKDLPAFIKAFESAIAAQAEEALAPVILTDGVFPAECCCPEYIATMENTLAPFGREFEAPIFEARCHVIALTGIGDGTHARLTLHLETQAIEAVWFSARQTTAEPFPVQAGEEVLVAFSPKNNHFRGQTSFNPHIVHCEPVRETIMEY